MLDGLRGLAVLVVFALHMTPSLAAGGIIGVDVFFVLSGFLITALLVQEVDRTGSIHFGHFYLRRGLRLLPALVVMLLVYGVYSAIVVGGEHASYTRKAIVSILCYYHNWRVSTHPDPRGLLHCWSLSVEEQFYFLWPLALAGLLRLRLRRGTIMGLVALAIVASAGWRAWSYGDCRLDEVVRLRGLYTHLDTRADALLSGCLAALLASWTRVTTSRRAGVFFKWVTVPAALFLACQAVEMPLPAGILMYGGFTLIAVASGVLILGLLGPAPQPLRRLLEAPALAGRRPRVLRAVPWHYPVCTELQRYSFFGSKSLGTYVVLQVGLSFGVTLLSYYGIERPLARLKPARLRPTAATPAESAQVAA